MVEVFKTDVHSPQQAQQLRQWLAEHLPGCRVNFDLHDCDRVLRVEGDTVSPEQVCALLQSRGACCEILT